jgi:hypothetical protein
MEAIMLVKGAGCSNFAGNLPRRPPGASLPAQKANGGIKGAKPEPALLTMDQAFLSAGMRKL